MSKYVIFFIINLLSFLLCGLDKNLAKKEKRRIPEFVFFLFALLGGPFGLLFGMYLFRHKTKKPKFKILVPILAFLWVILMLIDYCYPMLPKTGKYYEAEYFNLVNRKSTQDENENGVDDFTDILLGARKDAVTHPTYKSAYYKGGYPPDNEGVCTDVIWRAFKNAGYLLKDLVDEDIKNNLSLYPRVAGKPDPNIDFRRVKNLKVYFDLNSEVLTNDISKIEEWNPGDIVIFGEDYSHIAIVSDKRNKQGIPWIIHNANQKNREEDALVYWNMTSKVVGHYRFHGKEN